jgi:hypothetical protein
MAQSSSRKGQIWATDFVISMFLFIVAALLVVKLVLLMVESSGFEAVRKDAVIVSETLMGEGYPKNWTNSSVIRIGLTNNNRLNVTKLNNFSEIPYSSTKSLLNTHYDYFFYFKNSTEVLNITQCGYGHPDVNRVGCANTLENIDYDNLVKVDRVIIYNSTFITMRVYLWD